MRDFCGIAVGVTTKEQVLLIIEPRFAYQDLHINHVVSRASLFAGIFGRCHR
jgi:hypothetical protein